MSHEHNLHKFLQGAKGTMKDYVAKHGGTGMATLEDPILKKLVGMGDKAVGEDMEYDFVCAIGCIEGMVMTMSEMIVHSMDMTMLAKYGKRMGTMSVALESMRKNYEALISKVIEENTDKEQA